MTKLLFILAIATLPFQMQESTALKGKTFKALVNESCREFAVGGCMINTYRIFNFKADSVTISYDVIAYCSPKESEVNYKDIYDRFTKTYTWSVSNDTLRIDAFDDYGTLVFQHGQLLGEDKNTKRHIVFSEVQE